MGNQFEYLDGAIEYQLENAVICGNILALLEALYRYSVSSRATPIWLLHHARKLILQLLTAPRRRQALLREIKYALIHLMRHGEVEEIREKQAELKKLVAELKVGPRVPADMLRYRKAQLKAVGSSWEVAYSRASRLLGGTAVRGSPSAMKESHKLVERASGYCHLPYRPALANLDLAHLDTRFGSGAGFETLLFDGNPPKWRKNPYYQPGVPYGKEAQVRRRQMQQRSEAQKSNTNQPSSESEPQAPPKLLLFDALNIPLAEQLKIAVERGNILALLDGLDFQKKDGDQAAPKWLLEKAFQTIVVLLRAGGKSRGRKGNPVAKAWAELTDVQRFCQLLVVQQQQKAHEETYTTLKHCRHPDDRKHIPYFKEQHRHYGKGIRQAARLAARELAYTPWPGNPEAVEKSYRKVLRNRELIACVWQSSPSLSQELGLLTVFDFDRPPRQATPCPWDDDGEDDFNLEFEAAPQRKRSRKKSSGASKMSRV